MDDPPILLGTTNPAKQRKLSWLLRGLPLKQVTPQELGSTQAEPRESGDTHEKVARQKAVAWSDAASGLAISSDGGLVIPALGKRWESLHTRRFAGIDADDQARRDGLVELMQPYHGDERRASWVEALAIADGGRTLASWQVEGPSGVLPEEPRPGPAVSGFWAFSIWYFPELRKTYDQLTEEELEHLGDHWSQLRLSVVGFLRGHLGIEAMSLDAKGTSPC